MPYITQLDGAFVTVGADASVVKFPPTSVLNDFGTSAEFSQFNVADDETGAGRVVQGDYLAPVMGEEPLSGTYLGSGFLANAGLKVGTPSGGLLSPNLGLGVTLNPLTGNFIQDADGNVHMITEQPLNADHLGVTLTLKLPGLASQRVNVPLSELDDTLARLDPTGLLKPVLGPITNVSQYLLDTAAVTLDFDPTDPMILGDEQINDIVCFARGTLIETEAGPVAVEDLREGDLVITRDNGAQPVRWIGSVRLDAAALRANPKLRPIRIRAGALGDGTPAADLVVSPQHRVLVRSSIALRMFGAMEVLVAAKQLLTLDGIDIAEDAEAVEYFHFLLDRHEVVWSNGAPTESLYTGAQALQSVGRAAREEILGLFPALREAGHQPAAARSLPSGRQGRRLAMRHVQHGKPLVM